MLSFVTGANSFNVNVEENVTIASPKFLFVFVNDLTGKKVACTSVETITDDFRSAFTITIQASPTALSGQIYPIGYGFYHYYIYERTAVQIAAFSYSTIDTVDLRTLTGLVDEGKMQFTTTAAADTYSADVRESVKTYII